MERIKNELKQYIAENGNSHILIHSDILYGFNIKFETRDQFFSQTFKELQEICQPLDIIMPTFNYDFCKGKPYNVKHDESQVGILSEYFRQNRSSWRSSIPVFNFSGTGVNPLPNFDEVIDPFDENSLFGFLNKNKGLLMHYGSSFQATTLIHYVERVSGKLIYRYDKEFRGTVNNTKRYEVNLIYHVRPKDFSLNYDMIKLENDLLDAKLLYQFKEGRTQILMAKIDDIVNFWLHKLDEDPFYFLNTNTKERVIDKYQELNRSFLLTDFE